MAQIDKSLLVEEEAQMVPVLPLRDVVVFPFMVIPLFVGRMKSIRALEEAMSGEKQILLVSQRNAADDDPQPENIYRIGTLATILQLLKLPDGTVKVLVEGTDRARIVSFLPAEESLRAQVQIVASGAANDRELEALMRSVSAQFEAYVKLNKKIPPEILSTLASMDDPARLADTVAAHLSLKLEEKQEILEKADTRARLEHLLGMMESEIDLLQVEKRIRGRVKRQMEKSQREYYLNEQMKAIQKELGDLSEEGGSELDELTRKIGKSGMPKDVRAKADAELKKLRMMSPMSAEATVVRNYIDWLVGVPWRKRSKITKDLKRAKAILDADHYGLEDVKERILEYLAVQERVGNSRGPILCLVGPPGVGKTSLGRSIAAATGRKFVRMSLGGVRDEAEIRGHRRTYIGALPGKIVQSLAKIATRNPLMLLDEVDKMAMDFRGDPASALLEVLDPEQNATFNDHYLEVDFNLSEVMFVTTANTLNIPAPLMDRMEVIRISGYTEDEKIHIATKYLLPKQIEKAGLLDGEMQVSQTVIRDIIRYYTREAGVRNLERELARICRKVVKELLLDKKRTRVQVSDRNLDKYLGVRRFDFGKAEKENRIGEVTGLAWTEVGGELLSIEAVVVPGRGKLLITGKLGDVMQESIQAAMSVVRARSRALGIPADFYQNRDVHIHVPEGATPKDGPSAGIGMATALVSALTNIPVHATVAMTGEITLRGEVLPIGGLKEKLLAAHRGGISTVLIPAENEKDLQEIPKNVRDALTIKPVRWIDEVLAIALESSPMPLPDSGEPMVGVVAVNEPSEDKAMAH
ncbi:MAG: endopeptidase La [Acidithiobacillus sp.]|nr:endopeptidase La [Acidithiobacillus sp.]MCK9187539.1 endopeptidase La [Acidithiobacillus sp.]MCK9358429.1 endopeptidase La [Acidithiobacillus sp.]